MLRLERENLSQQNSAKLELAKQCQKNKTNKQHRQKEQTKIYVYTLKAERHKQAKKAINRVIRQQRKQKAHTGENPTHNKNLFL